MLKFFFLFWPANVMPLWLLISLLQLKLPLTTLLRSCCINEVSHYFVHWLSAIVIFGGCIVHLFRLSDIDENINGYKYYCFYILFSCVLDVISHTIKEALVRTQPLNQESFNFQIGIF
jgi:hypothetical protein